jgi:hypothetical protein
VLNKHPGISPVTACPVGRIAVSLMLVAVVTGVYDAVRICLQDLEFTRVQTEISFWGRGTYQPPQGIIEHAGDVLSGLLQAASAHPEMLELEAHYLAWSAYRAEDMDRRGHLMQAAVDSQYLALLSRPANRQGWSKMVEYASWAPNGEAMLQLARKRLASLRPPEASGATR